MSSVSQCDRMTTETALVLVQSTRQHSHVSDFLFRPCLRDATCGAPMLLSPPLGPTTTTTTMTTTTTSPPTVPPIQPQVPRRWPPRSQQPRHSTTSPRCTLPTASRIHKPGSTSTTQPAPTTSNPSGLVPRPTCPIHIYHLDQVPYWVTGNPLFSGNPFSPLLRATMP